MSSRNGPGASRHVDTVLATARERGIKLWAENGQLRFHAPKGALDEEDKAQLRRYKPHILCRLERHAASAALRPKTHSPHRVETAPLTFSQLAHWRLYRLSERPAIRQMASATRLHGRLSLRTFDIALAEIIRRHGGLRTQFVICNGVPEQVIAKSREYRCEVVDLTSLAGDRRDAEMFRLIDRMILEPTDLAKDPLFGVRLLKLDDEEHVLVIVMEHMISDAASMGILLSELLDAYRQASEGQPNIALSPVSMQFADYARWQRDAHQSWIETHQDLWIERLSGFERVRFPDDPAGVPTGRGWGRAPLRLGSELTGRLREWCRERRTTLVIGILAAYSLHVLRWCHTSKFLIQYQSDGRTSPHVANTLGYFASPMYLRVAAAEGDRVDDVLARLAQEYCDACEHADYSYMAAQLPRPDFTRTALFNWIPQRSMPEAPTQSHASDALTASPVQFTHPMLRDLEYDHEPIAVFYELDSEVSGGMQYPRSRFAAATMEKFAGEFLSLVESMVRS